MDLIILELLSFYFIVHGSGEGGEDLAQFFNTQHCTDTVNKFYTVFQPVTGAPAAGARSYCCDTLIFVKGEWSRTQKCKLLFPAKLHQGHGRGKVRV